LEALEDVDGTIMMLLGSIGELDPSDGSAGAKVRGAIASLRTALAQQERAEPDWIKVGDGTLHGAIDYWQEKANRKPLTSAQIRAIEVEVAQSHRHDYPTDAEAFARAIERAHGIGDEA
jgi:hypothetical protein